MRGTHVWMFAVLILAAVPGHPQSLPEAGVDYTLVPPPGSTAVAVASPVGERGTVSVTQPNRVAPSPDTECNGNWRNAGGTPGRNGRSGEVAPVVESPLWSGGRTSLIAWQPIVDGDRVFMVRQTQYGSTPQGSPVVAMDLATGSELWAEHIPYGTGDWTTWIAGAARGLVYTSRSGNGASVQAPVYALDADDGSVVWASQAEVDAGAYDGVVLAPNGDLVVGNFTSITRIRSSDGTTAWSSPRTCSVSSSCGPALHGDAIYVADAAPGGHVIVRFDLAAGTRMYESQVMPGFTLQNTPFVGPDGTVYLSRTQNNTSTDYFYAFEDTGAALVERWHVPAAWTTHSEFAVAVDGSPFMFAPGHELVRLDPATGATVDSAGLFPECTYGIRMATDGNGTFSFGNGAFPPNQGRLRVFDANLDPLWDTAVTNINIGGPAIGRNGTVVVCGVSTDVRAYRSDPSAPVCPSFADGFETGDTSVWSVSVP